MPERHRPANFIDAQNQHYSELGRIAVTFIDVQLQTNALVERRLNER